MLFLRNDYLITKYLKQKEKLTYLSKHLQNMR
jgi:hypothetical protein